MNRSTRVWTKTPNEATDFMINKSLLPENDDSIPNGEMKSRRLSINSRWIRLDAINGNKHDENRWTGTSLGTRHPSIFPLIHPFITSLQKQTTWHGLEYWNVWIVTRCGKDFREHCRLQQLAMLTTVLKHVPEINSWVWSPFWSRQIVCQYKALTLNNHL